MHYREQCVAPPLDALVECVWFLSDSPGDAAPLARSPQPILPDGCVELIFHFDDPFHAVDRSGAACRQPAAFVVGMLTTPLVVRAADRVDTMAIRFRPGGAYPFFPGPLSALTDRAIGLDQLWGRAGAEQLFAQLAGAVGDSARIALATRLLANRVSSSVADTLTAAAVRALVASGGRVSIDAVAARSGVTMRHLQRQFADRVGVGPKMLARILRFQRTLLQRGDLDPRRRDWVRIAMDCGYTDQSHLIHDYSAFAGATPASLAAAQGELSAYFTAPQRLAALFARR
jgi:AraC-like DNA-binding protein